MYQAPPTKSQQPVEDPKQLLNQWPNPSMPDPRMGGGQPQPPLPPTQYMGGYPMGGYPMTQQGQMPGLQGQPGQPVNPQMGGGTSQQNWSAMFAQFSNQVKELGKQGYGVPQDYGTEYLAKDQGGHNPRDDYGGGGYKQNYGGDNRRQDNQGGQRGGNFRQGGQGGGYRDRPQGDFRPRDGGDRRDFKRKSRSRSREKDFHNRGGDRGDRRNDRGDRNFDKGGHRQDDRGRRDDFRGGDRGRDESNRGGGGKGGDGGMDWRCTDCNNVNWARRDTCNRCKVQRPPDAPLVEPRRPPGGDRDRGDRGGDRGYQHRDQGGERREFKPRNDGPRYERGVSREDH